MDYIDYRYDSSWVRPYLGPGESILWQGKPQRANPFTANDVFIIPFSLFWCGSLFSMFWKDFKEGIGIAGLFSIPFVLAGLYFLFGRLIYRWHLLKHTSYVITTQKVLRRRNRKVDILQGISLPQMNVKEHRDGLKSIIFCQTAYDRRNSFYNPGFALEFLPDAERALRAIDSMRGSFGQQ